MANNLNFDEGHFDSEKATVTKMIPVGVYFGTIVSENDCKYSILISEAIHDAAKATSCLITPMPGDYVACLSRLAFVRLLGW